MPYLPRLASTGAARSDITKRSSLSNAAIIVIAIASAAAFFVCLALLLIRIANWQERRRGPVTAICPASGVSFLVGVEPDAAGSEAGRSNRLRKKSFVSERHTYDNNDARTGSRGTSVETGEMDREREDGRLGVPPPVLPPVLSRPGSFTFGLFGGDGVDRDANANASASAKSSTETQRQKKYNKSTRKSLQDRHRTPSWIDEDALHGPLMAPSPSRKNKGIKKNSRFLSLGRSLSRRLSWRREEVIEIIHRSPTLPHTKMEQEQKQQESSESEIPTRRVRDARLAAAQERLAGVLQRDPNIVVAAVSPQQPQPEEFVAQPGGSSLLRHESHTGFIVGMPSDSVHNPKHRNSAAEAALEATEQLAGSARVPVSSVPQPQPQSQQSQQVQISPQRPQQPTRAIKSATDAELAGILRSTAERLQDRRPSGSLRRRTMASQGMGTGIRFAEMSTTTDDRDSVLHAPTTRVRGSVFDISAESSPAKTPKSAPAVMSSYAELEGCSPNPQASSSSSFFPPQPTTPGHRRQASHTSFASMISEPDSLMPSPSRRGSSQYHEVQQMSLTVLSSPNRRQLERDSTTFSDGRPYSATSGESSALSTLYSEDETHMQGQVQQGPPSNELRFDNGATHITTTTTTPTRTRTADITGGWRVQGPRPQTYSSPYHNIFNKTYQANGGEKQGNNRSSAKFAFEDGESPRPWRARRGTVAGPCFPQEQQQQQQQAYPTTTSNQEHIEENDDPFLTNKSVAPLETTSLWQQQQRRPSRLLPPLPVELAADEVESEPIKKGSPSSGRRLPLVHVTKTATMAELPTGPATRDEEMDQAVLVVLPPQVLRPVVSSPTLGAAGALLDVERRSGGGASPAISEAGLSSVYDSYNYAESVQADGVTEAVTLVAAVPRIMAGSSPTRDIATTTTTLVRSDNVTGSPRTTTTTTTGGNNNNSSSSSGSSPFISSPSGRGSRAGFRASHQLDRDEEEDAQYCIDSKKSIARNSYYSTPPRTAERERERERDRRPRLRESLESKSDPNPRSLRYNNNDDDDDDDDALPPLPLTLPLTPTKSKSYTAGSSSSASNSNNLRVANSIAELRRMNSQLSSASGHSGYSNSSGNNSSVGGGGGGGGGTNNNTDTEPGSPTLPALRGGGCSPGSRNRDSGRNYLSLGGSSTSGDSVNGGNSSRGSTETSPVRIGRGGGGGGGLQWRSAPVGGRSRRGTMVGLNHGGSSGSSAERVRNSVGVLTGDGNSGNVGVGVVAEWARQHQQQEQRKQQQQQQQQPVTTGASSQLELELERENGVLYAQRTSARSLGLYDEQSFLKSSPPFRGGALATDGS